MLSFSLDDITSVLSSIQGEVTKVEDLLKALQNAFSPIQGGAWQGPGAQAFMNEFMGTIVPEVTALIAAITGVGSSVTEALNIVSSGDDQAASVVGTFTSIVEALF